jgi:N-acyl-D-amino-acid deacylase
MAAARHDLVIRRGTIVDGTGGQPFEGDVAIAGGKILAVGTVTGSGIEEIDAKGMLVTPGFVDVHTHFDGQITWSDELSPVSHHGVTSVLMGNCGVGFAPCRPEERQMLLELMEGVEDIPGIVMEEGIPWNWESFPDFLDALEQRPCDVDFGTLIAHAPVRINVMGRRGHLREPATARDVAQMSAIVKQAVAAGAFGFSTTRSLNNRSKDGSLAPTITASEDELMGMACAMGELGKGVIEMNDQWLDATPEGSAEFDMMRRVVKASGRPLSFSLNQQGEPDKWKWILSFIEQANRDNIPIRAQVISRPIGVLVGLDLSLNPFMFCPSFAPLEDLPLDEKVKALRDPSLKAKLLAEEPVTFNPFTLWVSRTVENMTEFGDPPDYAPPASAMLGERAKREGKTVLELAYDLMLEKDGHAILYHPVTNYMRRNLDHVLTLLRHENSVIGVGDGGAHVGMICDASIPTHLLTYWTRDRQGERLSVPEAIRTLTHDTSRLIGLLDRGLLKPGLKADINVIDYDRLHLHAPHPVYDLPAGARRLMQKADGYAATIVSGIVTYRGGTATGARPGRLLRGPRSA